MLKKEVPISIPSLPSFIKVGKEQVSISELKDNELEAIGAEWTKELILSAKRKRRQMKTEDQPRGPA